MAVNFFKSLLLDQLHVPGQSQCTAVFEKIYQVIEKPKLTERTWQGWFSKDPGTMQKVKAKELDDLLRRVRINKEGSYYKPRQTSPFFERMVHGGLVVNMIAPTRSTDARQVLANRAYEYIPSSVLHLHLDAIELNTLVDDFHGVPWQEVMKIASLRIFDVLFNRWNPRHGQIYSTFSSPLKLRWDTADADERENIQKSYMRLKPNLFERDLKAGATPDWIRIDYENSVAPQHIYKILFSMAADPDFLIVDRLETWALDLATAGLVMRALAWTDRYSTFGIRVTHEMLFWGAFDCIFFGKKLDHEIIVSAMRLCNAEWDERSIGIFETAREIYHRILAEIGLSAQQVKQIVAVSEEAHPLVYEGE
ncbi:MAG: hypothetical protein AB2653_01375 [Candidatus Thiodiazotropha endolucinida]